MNATNLEILATVLFALAIVHTFSIKFFKNLSDRYPHDSMPHRAFHFLAEVEVVFGLWAGIFVLIFFAAEGQYPAIQYLKERNFTEPLFVFVIMVVASTRPIIESAEMLIHAISKLLPLPKEKAFYISALFLGPILGSFITEPAAMTVTALLMRDRFFEHSSQKFKYLTLGTLFVNVSIGGVLTSYAAPPVLMVASTWGWNTAYMLEHFGFKAVAACATSVALAVVILFREFPKHREIKTSKNNSPWLLRVIHLAAMTAIVVFHQTPVLFVGLFLFFIGIHDVTRDLQSPLRIREGLLVGFFLAGLVVLGGLQRWWLEPLMASLNGAQLFFGTTALTGITDNAALTYLGAQIPNLSDEFKYYLVAGAVTGGGLTVIANAPNPAGFSILSPKFGGSIHPGKMFLGSLLPTAVAIFYFYVIS